MRRPLVVALVALSITSFATAVLAYFLILKDPSLETPTLQVRSRIIDTVEFVGAKLPTPAPINPEVGYRLYRIWVNTR